MILYEVEEDDDKDIISNMKNYCACIYSQLFVNGKCMYCKKSKYEEW